MNFCFFAQTENNQLKLKNTKLAGQLGDGREQMTILDVENSKVNNRCEVKNNT